MHELHGPLLGSDWGCIQNRSLDNALYNKVEHNLYIHFRVTAIQHHDVSLSHPGIGIKKENRNAGIDPLIKYVNNVSDTYNYFSNLGKFILYNIQWKVKAIGMESLAELQAQMAND